MIRNKTEVDITGFNFPFCSHFLSFSSFFSVMFHTQRCIDFLPDVASIRLASIGDFPASITAFSKNRQNIRDSVTGRSVFCRDQMPHLRNQKQLPSSAITPRSQEHHTVISALNNALNVQTRVLCEFKKSKVK